MLRKMEYGKKTKSSYLNQVDVPKLITINKFLAANLLVQSPI